VSIPSTIVSIMTLTFQTVNFYVDDIKPVVWNDDAYSHLVYPEEQKDLVLSFVENHESTKREMDDVIIGKGKLSIIPYFHVPS
jgi:hypothetical protein